MNVRWFNGFILLWFIATTAGCGATRDESGIAQSKIMAVIDGQPILEKEFERFVALGQEQSAEPGGELGRNARFREFLVERLLLRQAREAKIDPVEGEIQQQLQEWLTVGQEVTPALRERVRKFLVIQKLLRETIDLRVTVSMEEMQQYYKEHQRELKVEDQAHILEIRVEDSNRAEEIRGKMTVGDVRSFKEAAKLYSQGLTAEKGGDLGTFERGQLPEDFEKFVFALKPGEVSSIFHSTEGYHIFMMEEWIPRHPQKFYEVQDTIFEMLVVSKERAAMSRYVRQLVDRASIELHDETLVIDWGDSNEGPQ